MGFTSNQWLNRGSGERDRKYQPVPVTIEAATPSDTWSQNHEVLVEFSAHRENEEYQTLLLTAEEAESTVGVVIAGCGVQTRAKIALDLIKAPDLFDVLSMHQLIRALYLRSVLIKNKHEQLE